MEDNVSKSPKEAEDAPPVQEGGGGWGGWDFSPFSVLSDLQKAATVAAEEISRNAVEVAKTAAKSISDIQNVAEDSESSKEDDIKGSAVKEENEDENDKRRKAALDKLEKASDDSLLGQGLKVIDSSVENFASGAWQALGSAFRGGSNLVHKLEHSAVNLADTIQLGGLPAAGSVAPSLIESGKAITAKGMQVLELVGKETMDLLITETGIEIDKNLKVSQPQDDGDQVIEEVIFDRCFYIYGGPEQLEELEALSNHYALLFNRRKVKLSSEQKSLYEGKLKQLQQVFSLSSETDGSATGSEKGKKIEVGAEGGAADEMKNLHNSSVSKAAEMAAGFANALAGMDANDVIQRTVGRLDSLHSEGVHRISEMCCYATSHLMMLGKSIISNANKDQEIDVDDILKIDWPEDYIEKAKVIRIRAQSMTGKVEAVCNSFITGIAEVAEAYTAAIKDATADSPLCSQKSIQEKAHAYSEKLDSDRTTAVGKIQDGLQYLCYVLISTSMPAD